MISTLSLVRDSGIGLPLEDVYDDEVTARREAGLHLAEISCLADRRHGPVRFFDLFREMCGLTAQLAWRMGVDEIFAAVHPSHTAFYRRYLAFAPIGDRRDHPSVRGNPAMALSLNFEQAAAEHPQRWQEFFGEPLPDDVLVPSPISTADREYFLSLAEDAAFPMRPRKPAFAKRDLRSEERLVCV